MERNVNLRIIAAGGAAINILHKYRSEYGGVNKEIGANTIKHVAIDTSVSNIDKAGFVAIDPNDEAEFEEGYIDVTPYVIAESGAGKNRASLLKDIQWKLDKSGVYNEFGDINIFIFSMSGGSGSVIAPLLIREAGKRGKRIIAIGIVDACSETDCFNSINTIRTLEAFAKDEKIYIPSMIFNNVEVGRVKVNLSIIDRLHQLEGLFVCPGIEEVDYTDKMNFLSPVGIVSSVKPGLYNMSIGALDDKGEVYGLPGEDTVDLSNGTPVHSTFTVSDDGLAPDIVTGVLYLGIVEDYTLTNRYFNLPFSVNVGLPISIDIINMLNDKQARYERAANFKAKSDASDQLQAKEGEVSSTGVIA